MPVEVLNDKGPTKRLKFLRNTAYNGSDYGPDYPTAEVEVDSHWAAIFLANGRAVEVGPGGPGKGDPGAVQTRDPEPTHRDPVLPAKKKS